MQYRSDSLVSGGGPGFVSGRGQKSSIIALLGVLFKRSRPKLGHGFDVTVLLLNIIKKIEWIKRRWRRRRRRGRVIGLWKQLGRISHTPDARRRMSQREDDLEDYHHHHHPRHHQNDCHIILLDKISNTHLCMKSSFDMRIIIALGILLSQ